MNRVVYVGMDVHKELTRVRASATKAKKRAKQNLISFLLRKGMVYPFGGRAKYWTQQFFAWLKTLEFAHLLDRYCFEEYLAEVHHQVGRVSLLDAKVAEVAENPLIEGERGPNENTNGLIRHYLPRGTSMAAVTQAHCDWISEELNTRPRELLGFRTPKKVYYSRV